MAKINLLPWRAERREHRKREFFTHLGIAAVAAIVLVLVWGFWVSMRIENQNNRNSYLNAQITQLDAKISEIKNLQKVKDHLLARKRIVEKLQSSRSQMVHLLDQIVKTIPSGARLTALKQQGDKLTLDGVAQSNATVADYMRKIEASPWMGPAALQWTRNTSGDSNAPYEFELVVTLGTPKTDDKNQAPATGSSVAAPVSAATAVVLPTLASPAAKPLSASSATALLAANPTLVAAPHASTSSALPATSATPPASAPATIPAPTPSTKTPRASAASTTKGGATS